MADARSTYDTLDEPWRVAMAQAWASWTAGCAGVGAVISDAAGGIVAVGRNRMLEERTVPGVLASTQLAHAEMNALAALQLGPVDGLTITTTFEPCLMCACTIVQSRIPHVRYASIDPLFAGMHDWFADFPFVRDRLPTREELGGPIGAFAHVLHVSWLSFWASEGETIDAHRDLRPRHLAVAEQVVQDHALGRVAEADGDVVDALEALWPSLLDLAD